MKTCPPPDPNTKVPKFKAPPKACDAHCHVFGPADRFPYHPKRSYTPPDAPFEAMRALHDRLGLERAVVVQATCHGPDNTAMVDAIARSEGRYRGVIMADETFTESDFATLDKAGCKGVRFAFARHIGSAPDFGPIMRMAEMIKPFGWHLVLYLEAPDVVENADAIAKLPVPIVFDHMCRIRPEEGLQQKAFQLLLNFVRDPNYWVKISCAERLSAEGPPFTDVVPFAQAVIDAAPDRVLWGTDWPHPNIVNWMPNDGDLVDLLPLYAPDVAVRQKILVDNPARLYGFDA